MYRSVNVSLESLPLLVAALRDSEVQIVYLDEDLPDSVVDNDNSDNDDDNYGVGIDEDNNDGDEAGEAGEYMNEYQQTADSDASCRLPAPLVTKVDSTSTTYAIQLVIASICRL